jgi:hypothetical protein
MEAEGPGRITRIWTADPQQGTVRIYLDDDREPAIAMPFRELFARLPLSFGIGGEGPENYHRSAEERLPMGHTTYCPIPFARSCRVTIEPEDDYLYYQINYELFPPSEDVTTFDLATSHESREIRQAQAAWDGWQRGDTASLWGGAGLQTVDVTRGRESVLLDRGGSCVITGLRIKLPPSADAARAAHIRDSLWVVAHFDDDQERDPSVRAPLGPLCLDFGQSPAPRALLAGTDAEGAYYLRFPMPFSERARVRLVNWSLFDLEGIEVSVLTESLEAVGRDFARFRAVWHIETPFGPDHRDYGGVACRILNLDGRDNYELLNVRGAGHFVGSAFHIDLSDAPTDRAAVEGDEMFFLDDDPRLTHYGTGTEDYLNDAWGVRGYQGPVSGTGMTGSWGKDIQVFGHRLHLSDPIPFVRRGRFTLEHGTGNNCSGLYRSIAYWYALPTTNRVKVEEARWEEIRNRG